MDFMLQSKLDRCDVMFQLKRIIFMLGTCYVILLLTIHVSIDVFYSNSSESRDDVTGMTSRTKGRQGVEQHNEGDMLLQVQRMNDNVRADLTRLESKFM